MAVKTKSTNSDLFSEYLKSCKGKVQAESSANYYHVDVVADAYTKGFEDGEKAGKKDFIKLIIAKELEKFTQKANQIYILSKNVIDTLKKKDFKTVGLFINLTFGRPNVIISVPKETLNNDKFVKLGYTKILENKKIYSKLFDEVLDIGFVANDHLNEDLLKEDGFGYVEKY